MPEALGKALRHFARQRFERDCPGLEFARGLKQHGVERGMVPANQMGQPFGFVGGCRGNGHVHAFSKSLFNSGLLLSGYGKIRDTVLRRRFSGFDLEHQEH
jgi:hypothetical protein